MSAVPQRPGSNPGMPLQPAPGLSVLPRVRRGRAARRGRKVSKLGLMFRSNPVRVTIGLLVVAGVVFGLVLLNIHVAQTSFHLTDLQRQAAELQSEQRRLRYEVAKAESPEKIVEMGTTLGLVAPAAQEYIDGPVLMAGGSPMAVGRHAEPDVAAKADSHAEREPSGALRVGDAVEDLAGAQRDVADETPNEQEQSSR